MTNDLNPNTTSAPIPAVLSSRHFAPKDQAKPLMKMVNRAMMSRLKGRMRKKGTTSSSDIKINHKKVKYW